MGKIGETAIGIPGARSRQKGQPWDYQIGAKSPVKNTSFNVAISAAAFVYQKPKVSEKDRNLPQRKSNHFDWL